MGGIGSRRAKCDCGKTLGAKNTSGKCRSCIAKHLNAQDWFQERRKAGMNMLDHNRTCNSCGTNIGAKNKTGLCLPCFNRDPECKTRRGRGVSIARRVKFQTDPAYARKVREHGRKLAKTGLGNAAIPAGSEPRKRAGRKISERRRLEAERRAEQARLANLSPFERQMEAIKNGARIVEKFVPPSRDYEFTLGGISNIGEAA